MQRFQYGYIFLSYGKERKIKISYSLIYQKGKIYKYPQDVFLMLWTLLGQGCDKNAISAKHFPKRGPDWKPKIGSFPPSTKPHLLNPLTMGPLFLNWLGASQRCSGCCVFAPLLSIFVFFHSHIISAVTSQFCYVLLHVPSAHDYPLWRMMWAFLFRLTLFSFIPSWAYGLAWHDLLLDWPIGLFFLSFFLLQAFMAHLFLVCFAFTSYCACAPAYCHFLPCWLTRLYFFLSSFFFGFLWPIGS